MRADLAPVPDAFTLLTGSAGSNLRDLAVAPDGSVYVVGNTTSDDFPLSRHGAPPPGQHSGSSRGFIARLDSSLAKLLGLRMTDFGLPEQVAIGPNNTVYVCLQAWPERFTATPGAAQMDAIRDGNMNLAVMRFSSDLSRILYATFVPGNFGHAHRGFSEALAVDSKGSAYVAGYAYPGWLRTTDSAFQRELPFLEAVFHGFLVKIDPSGASTPYATYLRGTYGPTLIRGLHVNPRGEATVTGITDDYALPVTMAGYHAQSVLGIDTRAFVTRFAADGSRLLFSNVVGCVAATAVTVIPSGEIVVAGHSRLANAPWAEEHALRPEYRGRYGIAAEESPILCRFNPDDGGLVGCSPRLWGDTAPTSIAETSAGALILTSFQPARPPLTHDGRFPPGSDNGDEVGSALLAYDPAGDLVYSGGLPGTLAKIASGPADRVYVIGGTWIENAPAPGGFLDPESLPAGAEGGHGFVMGFSMPPLLASPSHFTFHPYKGGPAQAQTMKLTGRPGAPFQIGDLLNSEGWLEVEPRSGVLPAEITLRVDPAKLASEAVRRVYTRFPVRFGPEQERQIHVEIVLHAAPWRIDSVVNAASMRPGPIGPSMIVSIFGQGFRPGAAPAVAAPDENLRLPASVDGTVVRFNGGAALVLYASNTQINLITPVDSVSWQTSMQIVHDDRALPPFRLQGVSMAPALFTTSGRGSGQALVLNQDGSLNSTTNPARPGSLVRFYATGFTQNLDEILNYSIASQDYPLLDRILAFVGYHECPVEFAGMPAGGNIGLTRLDVRLPLDVPTGQELPVRFERRFAEEWPGRYMSALDVTMAVQR
ncbi:MAG: hypothetical protein KIT09_06045 [Bryobacteraceae bacterium]|nr:hypothetical protein [Bryobacteraceae bacterium]